MRYPFLDQDDAEDEMEMLGAAARLPALSDGPVRASRPGPWCYTPEVLEQIGRHLTEIESCSERMFGSFNFAVANPDQSKTVEGAFLTDFKGLRHRTGLIRRILKIA